jgi:hypothetical protein
MAGGLFKNENGCWAEAVQDDQRPKEVILPSPPGSPHGRASQNS